MTRFHVDAFLRCLLYQLIQRVALLPRRANLRPNGFNAVSHLEVLFIFALFRERTQSASKCLPLPSRETSNNRHDSLRCNTVTRILRRRLLIVNTSSCRSSRLVEYTGMLKNVGEQKSIFYTVARIPLSAHGIQHASSSEQTGIDGLAGNLALLEARHAAVGISAARAACTSHLPLSISGIGANSASRSSSENLAAPAASSERMLSASPAFCSCNSTIFSSILPAAISL